MILGRLLTANLTHARVENWPVSDNLENLLVFSFLYLI
ncbi:hypothetical protein PALB_9700 [Pseudoalteromonas luteoviolacea B = ATCC 29581]|nr:hypothetical protein PALB_9700 [Pseudoalteromonas luteoviolacea B = ATCC 29581]